MEAATEEPSRPSRTHNRRKSGVVGANVVVNGVNRASAGSMVRAVIHEPQVDSRSKVSTWTFDIVGPGCSKTLANAFYDICKSANDCVSSTPFGGMEHPTSPNIPQTSPTPTDPLACHVCGCVFYRPVTLPCGHTFCKSCLQKDASRCCPTCGIKLPARLEINVLIKTLLEKWCPGQTIAARLLDEGNRLIKEQPLEALFMLKDALTAAPNNHAVLCSRSHAYYQLNMLQESLADADLVTRFKPQWSKGYYRRGMALSALGHSEEALISFGISIALDNNAHAIKPEVTRLLQRLLKNNNLSQGLRCSFSFVDNLNTSDCESNSNEEDDFIQKMKQSQVSKLPVNLLLDRIFYEVEKVKDSGIKNASNVTLNLNLVDPSDFDCILCCRTLWRPITTPCGHTYCSTCLERCLDYRSTCPLCMTSLADYLAVNQKQVTEFVERALVITLPSLYAARMLIHTQELIALETTPDTPVFVCTTAFPTISCPLFVFEPRYRLMVRRCVESGNRQFAMASCVNPHGSGKRYADYGTMLEIKDWVVLADGCSILSTEGVRRFQVVSRGEKDGYDTARVQFISDTPIPAHRVKDISELHDYVYRKGRKWFNDLSSTLQTEILRTFGKMPYVEPDWLTLEDGPSWTWWLLAILPLGQQLQVGILRTTCLEKRLKVIAKTLDHLVQCQQYPGLSRQHKSIKRGRAPTAVEAGSS